MSGGLLFFSSLTNRMGAKIFILEICMKISDNTSAWHRTDARNSYYYQKYSLGKYHYIFKCQAKIIKILKASKEEKANKLYYIAIVQPFKIWFTENF